MPHDKKSTRERLKRLEQAVGVLIGGGLGGPAGARLGSSAVRLHQASPLYEPKLDAADAITDMILDRLTRGRVNDPALQPVIDAMNRGLDQGLGPFEIAAVASEKSLKKRKPSAYNKRYGKCFKKLSPKFKKKNGSWKKNGFKRCAAAARKCAKK